MSETPPYQSLQVDILVAKEQQKNEDKDVPFSPSQNQVEQEVHKNENGKDKEESSPKSEKKFEIPASNKEMTHSEIARNFGTKSKQNRPLSHKEIALTYGSQLRRRASSNLTHKEIALLLGGKSKMQIQKEQNKEHKNEAKKERKDITAKKVPTTHSQIAKLFGAKASRDRILSHSQVAMTYGTQRRTRSLSSLTHKEIAELLGSENHQKKSLMRQKTMTKNKKRNKQRRMNNTIKSDKQQESIMTNDNLIWLPSSKQIFFPLKK